MATAALPRVPTTVLQFGKFQGLLQAMARIVRPIGGCEQFVQREVVCEDEPFWTAVAVYMLRSRASQTPVAHVATCRKRW